MSVPPTSQGECTGRKNAQSGCSGALGHQVPDRPRRRKRHEPDPKLVRHRVAIVEASRIWNDYPAAPAAGKANGRVKVSSHSTHLRERVGPAVAAGVGGWHLVDCCRARGLVETPVGER